MVTKIFTTTNTHSAHVRWYGVWSGGRAYIKPSVRLGRKVGLCAATTVIWLKKSIASNDRGILSAAELGPEHLMAIVQGACVVRSIPGCSKGNAVLPYILSLLQSQNLKTCGGVLGSGPIPPEMITQLLNRSGYTLLCFSPSVGNGHLVAIRYENQILQMFDANQGLFQYSEKSSFIQHMYGLFMGEYSDMIGGKWGVFKVIADM